MPKEGTNQPSKEWVLLEVEGVKGFCMVARGTSTRQMRTEAEKRGKAENADPEVIYRVGCLIGEPFKVERKAVIQTKLVPVKEAPRAQ